MQYNNINRNQSVWKSVKEDRLILLCLFVSVTQLFFQWYEIFLAIPLFLLVAGKRYSQQSRNTVMWLLVFSLLFLFGHAFNSGIESRTLYLIYLFPPCYYLVGAYLGNKYRKNEKVLIFILFTVVVMYAAYDLSLILYSVFSGDGGVLKDRLILDANGDVTRTATGFAIIMSVLIAGISLIITPKQKGITKWIRISGVALGLLALYGMMTIVTRTSLFEAVVMILFSVYVLLTDNDKDGKKNSRLFAFGLAIVILGGIVYYLFQKTSLSIILDVFNAFEARNTEGSDIGDAGGRLRFWSMAIEDLLMHPFGTPTGRISSGTYSHNMWLDIGITAGWIPFLIILVISIKNACYSLRLLKDKSYDYMTRLYFVAMFLCFIMGCFVEPVLDNVYRHFLVYLFFCGMVSEMRPKSYSVSCPQEEVSF